TSCASRKAAGSRPRQAQATRTARRPPSEAKVRRVTAHAGCVTHHHRVEPASGGFLFALLRSTTISQHGRTEGSYSAPRLPHQSPMSADAASLPRLGGSPPSAAAASLPHLGMQGNKVVIGRGGGR